MAGRVACVPAGFHTVNAYVVVPNSVEAIAFYEKAFGAKQAFRLAGPDGRTTMHAEIKIGDSVLMLSDENPKMSFKSPKSLGGTSMSLHLYVDNVDTAFKRAVAAGCTPLFPVTDMFWGDRFGKVVDPFGHVWGIATHKEDVSPGECDRRAKEWMKSMAKTG